MREPGQGYLLPILDQDEGEYHDCAVWLQARRGAGSRGDLKN